VESVQPLTSTDSRPARFLSWSVHFAVIIPRRKTLMAGYDMGGILPSVLKTQESAYIGTYVVLQNATNHLLHLHHPLHLPFTVAGRAANTYCNWYIHSSRILIKNH
jgi:hypothetical protein